MAIVIVSIEGRMNMERLTEKHYKTSDGHYMKCSETCCVDSCEKVHCEEVDNIVDRLGQIEDILGDAYDLDRLRELVEADKSERCVILGVVPDLRPGVNVSACFIVEDDGEIIEDNVYCAEVGPDSSGKMNVIYNTFDSGDFGLSEVGHRIFWDENAARKASKANGQRDL